MTQLTPKERVMNLFAHRPIDTMPCFSGQGMVTLPAIEALGWRFPEIHRTVEKMAGAAIKAMEMFDFDAAVVPFDLCIMPEAFGLTAELYDSAQGLKFPTIPRKWATVEEVTIPEDFLERGRMPVLLGAIRILKERIGSTHAIGSWILGPFTLAGLLIDPTQIMRMIKKNRDQVESLLDRLVDPIIKLAAKYREAGADYVCIREMSSGTDLLSPKMWPDMIQPRLRQVFTGMASPKVLHICGSTDLIVELMNDCGADAISVDHKNSLAESRGKIGNTLLFGNYDGFGLVKGASLEEIQRAVEQSIDAGVDAVWPGCDIWPDVNPQNLLAINRAIKEFGRVPSPSVPRL
jgi:[methyl-Co(III) methanol-specific corrinoid protein]:coenzyme M methyltransferase